jgi:hypothetical protein
MTATLAPTGLSWTSWGPAVSTLAMGTYGPGTAGPPPVHIHVFMRNLAQGQAPTVVPGCGKISG